MSDRSRGAENMTDRQMLVETYGSTIRSEEKIDAMNNRLDKGDARLAEQDEQLRRHSRDIQSLKGGSKRIFGGLRWVMAALAYPFGLWFWHKITGTK